MQVRQRRQFLRAVLDGAGLSLLGAVAGGSATHALAQSGPEPLGETRLGNGLLMLGGAGGNIVLLEDRSGIVMVDSGAPKHEKRVMDFIAERYRGATVELLLNTHWHLDHTGGNDAVGRAGAEIIAHENTRLWMSTEFHVDWQERTYSPRAREARPTETFYSSDPQPIEITHAGWPIEYGYLREAHTDGDIYVRFPDHNVVVAGGVVTVGQYPVPDYMTGGLLRGLIEATEKLIDMSDAGTLIVPASGAVQRRSHLEAQYDMLTTVRERMERRAREGKSVEEMLAVGITDEFDPQWGNNAGRFLYNAYQGRWGIGR